MKQVQVRQMSDELLGNGYTVLPLSSLHALNATRDALLGRLRRTLSDPSASFESYHETVRDQRVHESVLESLTDELRQGRHTRHIIEAELEFFRQFIGPDLCLQRLPYMRIARPLVAGDNVDYHRDTQYGRSPFELSVWIPFVDVAPEMALRILPGSHVAPESDYPTTQRERPDVPRGGLRHQLGFPYAPKSMSSSIETQMQPVPVKYGQILLFSLSVVHGQRINTGPLTRFSCDSRVVNGLAPIAWEASVSGRYYETLTRSAVSEQARRYAVSNQLPTNMDELGPHGL